MQNSFRRALHIGAVLFLFALIILSVGWELWWAPIVPGGSWLALKAVPLLFAIRGVLRGSLYTLQWAAMLVLLYFMEGVVRAWSDLDSASVLCAWAEIVFSLGFYLCAIFFVYPAKRAAQAAKRAQQARQRQQSSVVKDQSAD